MYRPPAHLEQLGDRDVVAVGNPDAVPGVIADETYVTIGIQDQS
jgi:hypothetical protein